MQLMDSQSSNELEFRCGSVSVWGMGVGTAMWIIRWVTSYGSKSGHLVMSYEWELAHISATPALLKQIENSYCWKIEK